MLLARVIKALSILFGLSVIVVFGVLACVQAGWVPTFESTTVQSGVQSGESTSTLSASGTTTERTTESAKKAVGDPSSVPAKHPVPQPVLEGAPKILPEVKAPVSAPGPLIIEKSSGSLASTTSSTSTTNTNVGVPSGSGALNPKDIILIANSERAKVGLLPLTYNSALATMAEVKARDMITRQYFAHVAPDGTDAGKLAEWYGYDYINLGENLALGDFTSSADVMEGWMNSPGHRANILKKEFMEIGVSAIEGNYEGRTVWYAVQEFGRPVSACPKINMALQQEIATNEGQITELEGALANLREAMDTSGIDRERYNAKVNDYNTIIDLYNNLIATTKADIAAYNGEVNTFNICVDAAS